MCDFVNILNCSLYQKKDDLSDLLSSASLLLTITAVLYSLWYGDIEKAINMKVPRHIEDRGPGLREVKLVLFYKSLPLTILSVILAMINLPTGIEIFISSISYLLKKGLLALSCYCPVKASYEFVVILMVCLAIHMINKSIKLKNKTKKYYA